jgi:hypothetical protein
LLVYRWRNKGKHYPKPTNDKREEEIIYREYFECNKREKEGCEAKKEVIHRFGMDDEIHYYGIHTCRTHQVDEQLPTPTINVPSFSPHSSLLPPSPPPSPPSSPSSSTPPVKSKVRKLITTLNEAGATTQQIVRIVLLQKKKNDSFSFDFCFFS